MGTNEVLCVYMESNMESLALFGFREVVKYCVGTDWVLLSTLCYSEGIGRYCQILFSTLLGII